MSSSSFYINRPGNENFTSKGTLEFMKKISVKTGIYCGKKNCQEYVNHRYGFSKLYYGKYYNNIPFEKMKKIESRVLYSLQHRYGYTRQHGKKEHFMLPRKKSAILKFVEDVKSLYDEYSYRF
jgi:hypothetical protein